jgi:hypothetical protein
VVERSAYDPTVFKVHYGKLTPKIYIKGERVLRIEVIAHNAEELSCGRSLPNFPVMVEMPRGMLERFLNSLHCMDRCFIANDLPEPSRAGKAKVRGVDYNQSKMRIACALRWRLPQHAKDSQLPIWCGRWPISTLPGTAATLRGRPRTISRNFAARS